MATNRGSKEGLLLATIESLRLVKTMSDREIRKGIDGVISCLERQANKHKPLKKK